MTLRSEAWLIPEGWAMSDAIFSADECGAEAAGFTVAAHRCVASLLRFSSAERKPWNTGSTCDSNKHCEVKIVAGTTLAHFLSRKPTWSPFLMHADVDARGPTMHSMEFLWHIIASTATRPGTLILIRKGRRDAPCFHLTRMHRLMLPSELLLHYGARYAAGYCMWSQRLHGVRNPSQPGRPQHSDYSVAVRKLPVRVRVQRIERRQVSWMACPRECPD